jgi:hypothetical protein
MYIFTNHEEQKDERRRHVTALTLNLLMKAPFQPRRPMAAQGHGGEKIHLAFAPARMLDAHCRQIGTGWRC